MKISLIHPSRQRAIIAFDTCQYWLSNASKENEIEYILSCDATDPLLKDYQDLFASHTVIVSDNKNVVDASNNGAKYATGKIFILVSDDFECYPNWDLDIVAEFKDKYCKLLKTFDGFQGWIVTIPIMDRAFYLHNDYIYYPEYTHMFCDTDLTHKAELEGNLIVRNDIVFKHNHYSVDGGAQKDELNVKADNTWATGKTLYLERMKNKFGLHPSTNVLNICADAKGHIKWIKSNT